MWLEATESSAAKLWLFSKKSDSQGTRRPVKHDYDVEKGKVCLFSGLPPIGGGSNSYIFPSLTVLSYPAQW